MFLPSWSRKEKKKTQITPYNYEQSLDNPPKLLQYLFQITRATMSIDPIYSRNKIYLCCFSAHKWKIIQSLFEKDDLSYNSKLFLRINNCKKSNDDYCIIIFLNTTYEVHYHLTKFQF